MQTGTKVCVFTQKSAPQKKCLLSGPKDKPVTEKCLKHVRRNLSSHFQVEAIFVANQGQLAVF